MTEGALPAQRISALLTNGTVTGAKPDNIRPASLDLALSDEAYRVDGDFLPYAAEPVRHVLKELGALKHDFATPLSRDATYAIRLRESFDLRDLHGRVDPKSSTGRTGVLARLVVDGVPRYDTLPRGYRGEAWLLIQAGPFPVALQPGETLVQARFFSGGARLMEEHLAEQYRRDPILYRADGSAFEYPDVAIDHDGSLLLTVDLTQSIAGYESVGCSKVLELKARGTYESSDFFRELTAKRGRVELKGGAFYILLTREHVRVPPTLACEMAAVDTKTGQFETHRAGFIDPGWGWGKMGEVRGRALVCEVIPFRDVVLRDGQPVAKIFFDRLTERANKAYDELNSNYSTQHRPRLSKHFREPAAALAHAV